MASRNETTNAVSADNKLNDLEFVQAVRAELDAISDMEREAMELMDNAAKRRSVLNIRLMAREIMLQRGVSA